MSGSHCKSRLPAWKIRVFIREIFIAVIWDSEDISKMFDRVANVRSTRMIIQTMLFNCSRDLGQLYSYLVLYLVQVLTAPVSYWSTVYSEYHTTGIETSTFERVLPGTVQLHRRELSYPTV